MVKKASKKDIKILADLAIKLWPSHTIEELVSDFENLSKDNRAKCFIKYHEGVPVGFAHCGLRYDYVEGTTSSPVGYLEGIFVEPQFRNLGFAKELITACEEWAKQKGCLQMASDCELTNVGSYNFHNKIGYSEANKIVCFKKDI